MTELPQRAGSLLWKKSTASGDSGCVEVARSGEMIVVRDSKDPLGPVLTFSKVEWKAFLVGVCAGQFDI